MVRDMRECVRVGVGVGKLSRPALKHCEGHTSLCPSLSLSLYLASGVCVSGAVVF